MKNLKGEKSFNPFVPTHQSVFLPRWVDTMELKKKKENP